MLHSGFEPLSRSSPAGVSCPHNQYTSAKGDGCRLPRQKVPQMHEFAVILVLDVYNAPAVLATTDRLAVYDHITFGANDSERDDVLKSRGVRSEGAREMVWKCVP